MQITIHTDSDRPIYRQVADEIKVLIVGGTLAAGTVLPTVRQLAADLGVNMNTVATAYRELQNDGLIAIRHGSGAVVTSQRTAVSNQRDVQRALRGALTEMLLAGMRRADILRAVTDELHALTREKS